MLFLDVINFINILTKNNKKLDKNKIKKTLKSTSFDALKKMKKNMDLLRLHQIKLLKIKK